MEPTFIAIQFESGNVAIMQLFIEATEENVLNEINRSDFGGEVYQSHAVISREDVPTNRNWRGAWRLVNGRITTDLAAAKAIAIDKLRAHRAPIMLGLDVDHLRATETGDTESLEAVLVKKRYWRDITANTSITGATTVNALKTALDAIMNNVDYLPIKTNSIKR